MHRGNNDWRPLGTCSLPCSALLSERLDSEVTSLREIVMFKYILEFGSKVLVAYWLLGFYYCDIMLGISTHSFVLSIQCSYWLWLRWIEKDFHLETDNLLSSTGFKIKGLVHFLNENLLVIYSPSCHPRFFRFFQSKKSSTKLIRHHCFTFFVNGIWFSLCMFAL